MGFLWGTLSVCCPDFSGPFERDNVAQPVAHAAAKLERTKKPGSLSTFDSFRRLPPSVCDFASREEGIQRVG